MSSQNKNNWTVQKISETIRAFQPACVLGAAADLNVFSLLYSAPATAEVLADKIKADPRATATLLDALAAMKLLIKHDDIYSIPVDAAALLCESSPENILPEIRHLANCHRRWIQLAQVVKTGKPAERNPSIRGSDADLESFIGAMHNINESSTDEVIGKLGKLKFKHLLDVGGASGTWTIAFLRRFSKIRATIFDLPDVIPMARSRIAGTTFADRVTFAAGDFLVDELPQGADLAWLSAICHQNSRDENQKLFAKAYKALSDGGTIVIRDVVMDASHTEPPSGALFAINMLVSTTMGGTYSFDEYSKDLHKAGFINVKLVHHDQHMNSLIQAEKSC